MSEREWKVWEDSIIASFTDTSLDPTVLSTAIPRIKDHWTNIFQELTLELPQRRVPGELTEEQATVIQEIIESSAQLVVQRLKHERAQAMGRLIQVELLFAQVQALNN
ncbi:MAG: hypothetical protein HEQ37_15720 [Acidovorax sp.]|nr:hypothetical protein [Acidovorax sp.]